MLSLFAFVPLYYAVGNVQPTTLIALCLAGGYLALRNRRRLLAGLFLSICGIKAQCGIPAVSALRCDYRVIASFVVSGLLIFVLPFAMLDPSALWDYADLVLEGAQTSATTASVLQS